MLFAAAGQIFGRIGNIINGDIVGYHSTLPWATVYQNPNSFFCMNLSDPSVCGSASTAVQPAAAYELLANIVLLALLFFLSYRLRRPGVVMLVYLFGYVITQFLLFFVRDNLVVSFLGLDWGLKQAQWTSLVVFILLLPITFLILRFSKPVPAGEVAATYGIPQKPEPEPEPKVEVAEEEKMKVDEEQAVKDEEPVAEEAEVVEDEQPVAEEIEAVRDEQAEGEGSQEKIESRSGD